MIKQLLTSSSIFHYILDWGEEKNGFLKMVFLMSVGYVLEK